MVNYTIGKILVLTCFKLLFIIALFLLNLYLYFSEPAFKEYAVKECGLRGDKFKEIFTAVVGLSSIYVWYIGYKSITYNELDKVDALSQKHQPENVDKEEISSKLVNLEDSNNYFNNNEIIATNNNNIYIYIYILL